MRGHSLPYPQDDLLRAHEYVLIREPQDPYTARRKIGCSLCICGLHVWFEMVPAIQLDRQPCAVAIEIQDVASELMLPTEFRTVNFAAAQQLPEQYFGTGGNLP